MAGAFLNAVPKYESFRLPSWAMRIAVQRRLGLPLLASAAAGEIFSKHGRRATTSWETWHRMMAMRGTRQGTSSSSTPSVMLFGVSMARWSRRSHGRAVRAAEGVQLLLALGEVAGSFLNYEARPDADA